MAIDYLEETTARETLRIFAEQYMIEKGLEDRTLDDIGFPDNYDIPNTVTGQEYKSDEFWEQVSEIKQAINELAS